MIATRDVTMLGPHGDDRPLVTLQTSPGITPARPGAFGLYHFAILLPERAALDDSLPISRNAAYGLARPTTLSVSHSICGIPTVWGSRSTPIDRGTPGDRTVVNSQ